MKQPKARQKLTDLEMAGGVWKAMQWVGAAPRTMQDLLSLPHTRLLDHQCPVPCGWANVAVEYALLTVRNAIWQDDANAQLWDSLGRATHNVLLVCDEGLPSYKGLHLVCKQTNADFQAWVEWHREATMIVNPVRSASSVVWCSRLMDMVCAQGN